MNTIPTDLLAIKQQVYDPNKFQFSNFCMEAESAEYHACEFRLNDYLIKFRVAKMTPTKIGHFVTCWKRIGKGPIQPYDLVEPIDFLVISTRNNDNFGHFVFPKLVLLEQNVLSKEGKGGKRAMRVYPPWEKTTNKQAQKTQQWQSNYFLDLSANQAIDCQTAKVFYSLLSKSI